MNDKEYDEITDGEKKSVWPPPPMDVTQPLIENFLRDVIAEASSRQIKITKYQLFRKLRGRFNLSPQEAYSKVTTFCQAEAPSLLTNSLGKWLALLILLITLLSIFSVIVRRFDIAVMSLAVLAVLCVIGFIRRFSNQ